MGSNDCCSGEIAQDKNPSRVKKLKMSREGLEVLKRVHVKKHLHYVIEIKACKVCQQDLTDCTYVSQFSLKNVPVENIYVYKINLCSCLNG